MQSPDPRAAARFSRLLESGMSKADAWDVIAVEVLVDAGVVMPRHLDPSPAPRRTESVQLPVVEAKLLKAIRIEPSENDRIKALLNSARAEADAAKSDVPSESSVIRKALRLGLDELEQRARR